MPDSRFDHKEAVECFFSNEASDYSNLFTDSLSGKNFTFRRRLEIVCQLRSGFSGELMDCACGSGEITVALLERNAFQAATIVDLSPTMLALTRRRAEDSEKLSRKDPLNLKFINSDIFTYLGNNPSNQFHTIICLGLIAHTGRLTELLLLLKEHLSPNGSIILQSTRAEHLFTKVIRRLTSKRYQRRHGYEISYFTQHEIINCCYEAGLKIVKNKKFSLGLPFGDKFWAKGNYYVERILCRMSERFGTESIYEIVSR